MPSLAKGRTIVNWKDADWAPYPALDAEAYSWHPLREAGQGAGFYLMRVAPGGASRPHRHEALEGIVVQHLTVARVAEGLGVAWNTANAAVLAEGKRALIDDATRFDGVKVVGVDEHVWRHTRHGDKYVTVIIDLTPIRDGTGPSRLLDMVEGVRGFLVRTSRVASPRRKRLVMRSSREW